jgi:hypothetical protein
MDRDVIRQKLGRSLPFAPLTLVLLQRGCPASVS